MKAFSVTWLNQVTVYTADINYKAYLLRKHMKCFFFLFTLHSRPLVSFDHVVLVTNEAESA